MELDRTDQHLDLLDHDEQAAFIEAAKAYMTWTKRPEDTELFAEFQWAMLAACEGLFDDAVDD